MIKTKVFVTEKEFKDKEKKKGKYSRKQTRQRKQGSCFTL